MLVETKARVGVFAIALGAYLPQFPTLVPEFEQQYAAFKKTIPDTVEVIDGGIVTTKELSMAAGDKFRAADVDLVILQLLTYATSYNMLPAVRDLDVPVVLVNVQKKKAPDYANTDTPTWLGELYACGAVGEMVADLERAGKRHAVILIPVVFKQHNQCFGKTAADMFLGQVDNLSVAAAKVARKLVDKKHRQPLVVAYHVGNKCHRERPECRRFKSRRTGNVWLSGKVGAIPEILHRLDEAQNLHSATNTILVFLDTACQQSPQELRLVFFGIDNLILLKLVNDKVVDDAAFFISVKNRPDFSQILCDNLFYCAFNHVAFCVLQHCCIAHKVTTLLQIPMLKDVKYNLIGDYRRTRCDFGVSFHTWPEPSRHGT